VIEEVYLGGRLGGTCEMENENTREIYRQLRTAQDKYTYFLLAAAGAAIALAVNQTQDDAIAWPQVPLALAVLCWGLSFFLGCQHVQYVNSTLYANADLLKIESGTHSEVGEHPQMIAAASEGIKQAIEHNASRANRLGHRQFILLVTGAVLYVVWHVVEMFLRTLA
jgi:hypothetical protein